MCCAILMFPGSVAPTTVQLDHPWKPEYKDKNNEQTQQLISDIKEEVHEKIK